LDLLFVLYAKMKVDWRWYCRATTSVARRFLPGVQMVAKKVSKEELCKKKRNKTQEKNFPKKGYFMRFKKKISFLNYLI